MESKLLYIFNDLAKENNIAIRNSFRFFITVLQNKKRKENDTLKFVWNFFLRFDYLSMQIEIDWL